MLPQPSLLPSESAMNKPCKALLPFAIFFKFGKNSSYIKFQCLSYRVFVF